MINVAAALTVLGGPFSVLLVMAIVFAETGLLAGFFLPGDSLLFTAGVLVAAGIVHVPLAVMALAVVVAAFAGDQVGYLIGRTTGPKIFTRPDSRVFSQRHAERARTFFDAHGSKSVVLARFVPVVRTFTPVVAGVGAMPYRRFVAFNAVGALIWGAGVLAAGYLLGGVPFVAAHVELLSLGIVALSVLPASLSLLAARARRRTPSRPTADEGAPASDELTGASR